MINTKQISAIHTMIKKQNLTGQKIDIILGATGGRTESVGKMTFDEATALISYLKKDSPYAQAMDNMRKKIISMGHVCGYRIEGTTKINIDRIDEWCKKYGKYKKAFNDLEYEELQNTVSQFEIYHQKFLESY